MNIPEGWKLVPVEMTAEMKSKAQNRIDLVLRVDLPEYDLTDGVEMAWDAALAAAPTPPAPEVEPLGYTSHYALSAVKQRDELSTTISVTGRKYNAHHIPLYTHPTNDGLRKAAEKALDILEDYHAAKMDIADAISILKKALA